MMRPTLLLLGTTLVACGDVGGAGGAGGAGACQVTAPRGAVTLEAFAGGAWEGLRMTLAFQRQPDARDAIRCVRTQAGPCAVTSCSNVGVDFVGAEPTCSGVDAGEVQVRRASGATVSSRTGQQFTLSPAPTAGEVFAVRATGGVVPGFEGRVALPPRVAVTSPAALTTGASLRLPASGGVTVRWTPLEAEVVLTARGSNGGDYVAECAFDGRAGVGEVPREVLDLRRVTHLEANTRAEARLSAGAYPITLRATWATTLRAPLGE